MSISILEQYIETGNHIDLEHLLAKEPELLKEKTSHDISPLMLSCYYQKDLITQTILKYTSSITIHEACAAGLYDHVQMMIDFKPQVIDEMSSHGFTPLGMASHFTQENIVRLLLSHKADPNICSENGFHVYPLHSALAKNHSEISKMLIEAGAEVNVLQHGRITPLHLAAQYGNIELIVHLLEQGADISIRTENRETASDIAFSKGFREIAEILKVS